MTDVKQESVSTNLFGTRGSCTCGFADVPAELPCEVHMSDSNIPSNQRGGKWPPEAIDLIGRQRGEIGRLRAALESICATFNGHPGRYMEAANKAADIAFAALERNAHETSEG